MKENQRVRLTKKLLRDSLITLLGEKNIHAISVREICDSAEINRTTFYKYYGSQVDLLFDIENTVLEQIEDYLSDKENQPTDDVRLLTQIATFMEENLSLCRLLINNTIDSRFAERLLQLPKIQSMLSVQLVGEYQSDEIEYVYQFVVNGGFMMIKTWINKSTREAPHKIAILLLRIIRKLLE